MRAARDKKPGFDFEFNGTVLKIKLRGEIDHHSAVSVRSSMDELIRRRRPDELVIDMSAVDFMDSSGLGLIMGRYAVVKEIGGEICVTDPNPRIERIMNLAGMERIIKIKHSNLSARNTQNAKKPRAEKGARPRADGSGGASASVGGAAKGEKGEIK